MKECVVEDVRRAVRLSVDNTNKDKMSTPLSSSILSTSVNESQCVDDSSFGS